MDDDSPRRPSLPPREEWPPALRPPLKEERKSLDTTPARATWPKGRKEAETGGMEDKVMAKITEMFKSWSIFAMRELKKEISPPKHPKGGRTTAEEENPNLSPPNQRPKRAKGRESRSLRGRTGT